MDEIINRILEFRNAREWKKFHTPCNLSKSIVIEAAELLENFQWDENYNEENVTEELADVIIYCILLADSLNLDIKSIVHDKISKNEMKYPVEKSKGNSTKYTEF